MNFQNCAQYQMVSRAYPVMWRGQCSSMTTRTTIKTIVTEVLILTSHVLQRVGHPKRRCLPPTGSSPMPLVEVRSVLTTMASSWREHVPRENRVQWTVRVRGVRGQGVQAVEPHLHHTLRIVRGLRRACYHLGTPIHPR